MSQGRPQPPLFYRLIRDAGGQSETFGMLLLLAITVAGTTAVVAFGSQAMSDIEDSSNLKRTEHTMTLLDSRGAMVALGDSDQQTVHFSGTGDGSFDVESGTGWISVTHKNHSTYGDDEEIYNRSLGKLVYERGDTKIAYQGGGVWRIDDDGTAQMISKPEFHYRGATLTLPIIRVQGTGSGSGDVHATIRSTTGARRIFPNSSMSINWNDQEVGAPYNESEAVQTMYTNPIANGTVNVTVKSEYYRAWADYFRTRTTSDVTVYDNNQTVHMQLLTLSDIGNFDTLNDDLQVGGYPEAHTLTNYTVTLKNDKEGAGSFTSMHWSFYANPGAQKFEMHVVPNDECTTIRDSGGTVHLSFYYENASSDQSQEWENTSVKLAHDAIESVDCASDYQSITVNFTATNTNMTYKEITASGCGGNSKWHFSDDMACNGGQEMGFAHFDQHDEDSAASVQPYKPASMVAPDHEENMSFLLNHYFALMGPSFDLQGYEGPGGSSRINEDDSSGTITYNQEGGKFLTYLHVTENEVEIEIG